MKQLFIYYSCSSPMKAIRPKYAVRNSK